MQASDSNPIQRPDRESLRSLDDALQKHYPHPIEQSELVLMDVSPRRLHAYWHITPWELEAAKARLKEKKMQLVLRFHDLSKPTRKQEIPPSFDIEISGTSGSQYVELWEDAKRYRAELGLLLDNGQLIDLARSNTVELPKAEHSTSHGTQSMILTPLADSLYKRPPNSVSEGGDHSAINSQAWQADDNQPNDATLQRGLNELFPLFPDPGAPAIEAHRLERKFKSEKDSSKQTYERDLTLSQAGAAPSPGPSVRPPKQPFEPPAEIDLESAEPSSSSAADSPGKARQDSFPLCSILDARDLAKELLEPLSPLESLQAPSVDIPRGFAFAPASRKETSPAPADGFASDISATADTRASSSPISSFSLWQDRDQELHIELHIHGRARPNSHFVFHGQLITTEADGSFSLRKELPLTSQQLIAQLLAGNQDREK